MKYEVKDGHVLPGPVTRITDNPAVDILPVFSPDGKQLMWTSTRTADHTSQLFIADFKLPAE
jgi:Tol biopolymer transport system component